MLSTLKVFQMSSSSSSSERCPLLCWPQGGVIGIQIKWDCNLDPLMQHCLPKYSFRRLDEKESNRTLYPGLNFRWAKVKGQMDSLCSPFRKKVLVIEYFPFYSTSYFYSTTSQGQILCFSLHHILVTSYITDYNHLLYSFNVLKLQGLVKISLTFNI